MMQEDQMLRGGQVVRWLLPLSALAALAGYLGPWVDHPVAGLTILGLDLGEYVKFLSPVRSGAVSLWREGFYLPLLAVSLTCSLAAFRRELAYPWAVRALLLAAAVVAALNLLPPAWTPQRMLTPEFQQQTLWIALCLAAMVFSPFLALLPRWIVAALVAALSLAALVLPLWQFFQVLPAIAELYNHPLAPGWGLFVTGLGLGGLLAAAALLALPARTSKTDPLTP
jgi:hypothetical protein